MSRSLVLVAVGGLAAVLSACYEPAYIPPKPTPAEIVRDNARAEMAREFAKKPELKSKAREFVQKVDGAETYEQLRAAWLAVYPDHGRVLSNTIAKSTRDFYWPVAAVPSSVYIAGMREAAESFGGEES
jgi:hypothetical protein